MGDDQLIDTAADKYEAARRKGSARMDDYLLEVHEHLRERLFEELVAVEVELSEEKHEAPNWCDIARTRDSVTAAIDSNQAAHEDFGTSYRDFIRFGRAKKGGICQVHKARQLSIPQYVALKSILPHHIDNVELNERLRREAHASAKLSHTNIVRVHAVGRIPQAGFFIAMEWQDGGTLADQIGHGRFLPIGRAVSFAITLAEAIEHAHGEGVVHRDLKPSNVLFSKDQVIKIADFGLAKICTASSPQLTRIGQILGTPCYMAPEQVKAIRPVGNAADIWAIGVIFYEMLTGHRAIPSENAVEAMEQVCTYEPPPPRTLRPEISSELERVCLTCLKKEPKDRYKSAQDLVTALKKAFSPVHPPIPDPVRKIRPFVVFIAAAIVIIVGLVAFQLLEKNQEISPANYPDTQAAEWVQSVGGKVKPPDRASRLVEIDLFNNQRITDDDLKKFKGLRHLEVLNLGRTPIGDKGVKQLQDLPSLRTLNLNQTEITNNGLKPLQELASLSNLYLAGTLVTDDGLKYLASLPNLSVLHLSASNVTGTGLRYLPNLGALALGGMKVNLDELKRLNELKNLREFSLDNVTMTDAGLDYLRNLPENVTLLLIRIPLTAQQRESLKKDHPRTEFRE